MEEKPTPEDFYHTANVLQDIAYISGTGGKVGNPPSFPKNNIFRFSDLIFDGNLIVQKEGDKIRISVKETANESNKALSDTDLLAEAVKVIPKLSNYVVAKGYTPLELAVAVNRRLEDGWITLGGVSIAVETITVEPERGLFHKRPEPKTKEITIFIQAMGMPSQPPTSETENE